MKLSMIAALALGLTLASCSINQANASLIGTWGQGGTKLWVFNSDGTFSEPEQGYSGSYTSTSSTIYLTYAANAAPQGTTTSTYTYSISGNYLTLTSSAGGYAFLTKM
jgi:hypothetical protein